MSEYKDADLIGIVHDVLVSEAKALQAAALRLNQNIVDALAILKTPDTKIIVTGVGKSGHIARKIAATFCSTGTPAIFLHPSEAVHGDLGIYTSGDPTILISKSGTTEELTRLVPILHELQSPLIGIIGNQDSKLARLVDVFLDASVSYEADPYNLAPTTSTVLALALGDALAVALMQIRDFMPKDFARYHPGGQLGRNLLVIVEKVMHTKNAIAWVKKETVLKDVIIAMTECPLGAACVVDEESKLLGLITDGDIRRALLAHEDIRDLSAEMIMTCNPVHINPSANLRDAIDKMESRSQQISVLPVVDENNKCVGLLRIHDIFS